jgi:hypothetical protein
VEQSKMAVKKNETFTPMPISVKVTEKGGLSVYGLQRFPVTMYRDQWLTIIARAADLKAFIEKNADKLQGKPTASKTSGTTEL